MTATTAQQARIWAGLGVGLLLFISVIGIPLSTDQGNYVSDGSTFYALSGASYAFIWLAIVSVVAEAVLAGFTIFRMYHPADPNIRTTVRVIRTHNTEG
jgi:hypothetical protein